MRRKTKKKKRIMLEKEKEEKAYNAGETEKLGNKGRRKRRSE